MTDPDEARLRELLEMHPALLQREALEMRSWLLEARAELARHQTPPGPDEECAECWRLGAERQAALATARTNERDEARAQRDRLAEQITVVHGIHPRVRRRDRWVCWACQDAGEEPVTWPCATIAALGEATGAADADGGEQP